MNNENRQAPGKIAELKGMQKEKNISGSGAVMKDAHISSRNRRDQAKTDSGEVDSVAAASSTADQASSDTAVETLQILINSDHTIETPENFSDYVRKVLHDKIHNFESQITRIEVHFSDENGGKNGANDKRCMMEARLAGKKPIAVTDHGDTLDDVIDGASEKLKHALRTIIGREHEHRPKAN